MSMQSGLEIQFFYSNVHLMVNLIRVITTTELINASRNPTK